MQPSSLGYGSESDLARVLISCGQVANSCFGVRRPAEAPRSLRRPGCSPLRSDCGCGQRQRRRPIPPPDQVAVKENRGAEPTVGPCSARGQTRIEPASRDGFLRTPSASPAS
jgi:hypothetical protein